MKTITFYSYKGGVGRSLALSNIAVRLSELGKTVCVMDFDLDAPGLRFKFKDYQFSPEIKQGLVDYIFRFSNDGVLDNIEDYAVTLKPANDFFKEINFICAGNIGTKGYWNKHARIRWQDLFYTEQGQGIDFFLDLKSQIEKKFKPDYFLIDSRTGVTDISGITLRLLADHVVVMGINNAENLFGSKQVIKSILNIDINRFPNRPTVNFVLSRVPFDVHEKEKERLVVDKIREEFKEYLHLDDFSISVIHSNKKIEEEEGNLLRMDHFQLGPIINDYWEILKIITQGSLDLNENVIKIRRAQVEFVRYMNEPDMLRKLALLDEAIALDNTKYLYYGERGSLHYKSGNIKAAIEDHSIALKLNPKSAKLNYNMAVCCIEENNEPEALKYLDKAEETGYPAYYCKGFIYRKLNQHGLALEALNKALSLSPIQDRGFNTRADINRILGNYQAALSDILTAIQLKPDRAIYFATLAEIYASQQKEEDFYLNLTIALSKGLTADELFSAIDVYSNYFEEPRFLALMEKYDLELDDIRNGNYGIRNVGLA